LLDSYRYISQSIMPLMRIVLFLLLFQFISPAFLHVAGQGVEVTEVKSASLHPEQNSILLPLILKEKEEDEHEDVAITTFIRTQLIDFTDHILALTELHELKNNSVHFENWCAYQPPLFELHCTYII
jgi:hypothetical protein